MREMPWNDCPGHLFLYTNHITAQPSVPTNTEKDTVPVRTAFPHHDGVFCYISRTRVFLLHQRDTTFDKLSQILTFQHIIRKKSKVDKLFHAAVRLGKGRIDRALLTAEF